jgi:hypothetical protein
VQAWVHKSSIRPNLVWDDSGMGGRPGSVWEVSSLQLMSVVQGHYPPGQGGYEFKSDTIEDLNFGSPDSNRFQ